MPPAGPGRSGPAKPWTVTERIATSEGMAVHRHRFATEREADTFIATRTEEQNA